MVTHLFTGIIGHYLEDIFKNPWKLYNANTGKVKSPDQLKKIIEKAQEMGYKLEPLSPSSKYSGQIEKAFKLRKESKLIQYHPGGGHHGPPPYWKVSSPEGSTVRVGPQFKSK